MRRQFLDHQLTSWGGKYFGLTEPQSDNDIKSNVKICENHTYNWNTKYETR